MLLFYNPNYASSSLQTAPLWGQTQQAAWHVVWASRRAKHREAEELFMLKGRGPVGGGRKGSQMPGTRRAGSKQHGGPRKREIKWRMAREEILGIRKLCFDSCVVITITLPPLLQSSLILPWECSVEPTCQWQVATMPRTAADGTMRAPPRASVTPELLWIGF